MKNTTTKKHTLDEQTKKQAETLATKFRDIACDDNLPEHQVTFLFDVAELLEQIAQKN